METGDAESLRRAAHTLKSSSANVGATCLSEICREIEGKSRDGNLPASGDPILWRLEGEHHLVRKKLHSVLEGVSE
jgi:HPt (histidine-containing phosphotransfer) domain-containing protein